MKIVAKFDGESADRHVLPAFEGTQSLEGIARSITLISHYAATGEVRKRYPFSPSARVYIEPPRAGSFEGIFSVLTDENTRLVTTALGTLAIGVSGGLIVELMKLVGKRLIGRDHTPETSEVEALLQHRSGDIEALQEAVEPSLKKAHTVIGNGARQVFIISGSNNVINLNSATKEYMLSTDRDESMRTLLVSVAMLNANTRNGRVFNSELNRTVGIHVSGLAELRALPNLARSLQNYSARFISTRNSEVMIKFTTERAPDGTDKKYIIYDAYFLDE